MRDELRGQLTQVDSMLATPRGGFVVLEHKFCQSVASTEGAKRQGGG